MEEVVAAVPEGAAINLAGRTGVRELAAAVLFCDLFITPDTGPMRLAAALDVPLFAPTPK
ncbi:MAG: glycosyltransferase family 9 protein [Phycisphaerae bacterium]